ncbi:hypothetical protein E3N88_08658 [Mikania micrantha]|uniref:Uncharacterized protein n=1 Tax=Mikania micrantha TaxID=192012 RepID=A0A5N6PHF1_9ASTR|nr:hypothetical protein E3N88_08658 [Mikania micrantha]
MGSESELILIKQLDNLGETETKLKSNGLYHVEDANEQLLAEIEIGSSSPAVNKSSGLRKWRRRPRDLVKKTGSSLTSRENGDPTASLVHNSAVHVNDDPLIQPGFATGPNSGQSDWSSFVASGPRVINEVSYLTGGNSVLPDDQQRNGGSGTGKKARGFNMENENLNSTMGSDSRSSNFVFLQDIQSGIFGKHDEESSDDGHYADKPSNEEAPNVFIKSDAESEDASLAADESGKHEGSMDEDHLVESVKELHFAQVEFEREVQKWRDVGKDDPLTFDDLLHEILDLKDSKILKLESVLNSGDITTKIDDLLMKMIQTEFAPQNVKVVPT